MSCQPDLDLESNTHTTAEVDVVATIVADDLVLVHARQYMRRGKSARFGRSGAPTSKQFPAAKFCKKTNPQMPLDHKQFGSVFQAEGVHEILAVFEIGW